MLIRPARPDDYEAYCALADEVDRMHLEQAPRYHRPAGSPCRSREYYDGVMSDAYQMVFFAESSEEVSGFVHLEVAQDPDYPVIVPMRFAHILIIVVGKKHHRQGVGRALMHQAVAWAKEKGCRDLRLSVSDFNEDAKAFYQGEGFQVRSLSLTLPLD